MSDDYLREAEKPERLASQRRGLFWWIFIPLAAVLLAFLVWVSSAPRLQPSIQTGPPAEAQPALDRQPGSVQAPSQAQPSPIAPISPLPAGAPASAPAPSP